MIRFRITTFDTVNETFLKNRYIYIHFDNTIKKTKHPNTLVQLSPDINKRLKTAW